MTQFSPDRLRAIRRAAGQSREAVAVAASLSGSAVMRYEQGRGTPSINAAARLAEALGCQVTEFLDRTPAQHDISELPEWAQDLIRGLRAEDDDRELAGAGAS